MCVVVFQEKRGDIVDAIWSCRCSVRILKRLVDLGADYRQKINGRSLLMIAAGFISPEERVTVNKIKYLLSIYQGWAEEIDENGDSALHFAARISDGKGGGNVISLFLDSGFDPMLANSQGITPIEICISKNNPESFEPFWKNIRNNGDRFVGLGLQEICKRYSAEKIMDMINKSE